MKCNWKRYLNLVWEMEPGPWSLPSLPGVRHSLRIWSSGGFFPMGFRMAWSRAWQPGPSQPGAGELKWDTRHWASRGVLGAWAGTLRPIGTPRVSLFPTKSTCLYCFALVLSISSMNLSFLIILWQQERWGVIQSKTCTILL